MSGQVANFPKGRNQNFKEPAQALQQAGDFSAGALIP